MKRSAPRATIVSASVRRRPSLAGSRKRTSIKLATMNALSGGASLGGGGGGAGGGGGGGGGGGADGDGEERGEGGMSMHERQMAMANIRMRVADISEKWEVAQSPEKARRGAGLQDPALAGLEDDDARPTPFSLHEQDPAEKMKEAQGKVKVLLVDFAKLGMTKQAVLEGLKKWFAKVELSAEQIQMDAELEMDEMAHELPQMGERRNMAQPVANLKVIFEQMKKLCRDQIASTLSGHKSNEEELARLRVAAKDLEAAMENAKGGAAQTGAQLASAMAQVAQLQKDAAEQAAEWRASVDEYESRIHFLEKQVAQEEGKNRLNEQKSRNANLEFEQQLADAKKEKGQVQELQAQLEQLSEKLEECEGKLGKRSQELEVAEAELRKLRREKDQAAKLGAAEARQKAMAEAEAHKAEVERLRAEHADAVARLEAAAAAAAAAHAAEAARLTAAAEDDSELRALRESSSSRIAELEKELEDAQAHGRVESRRADVAEEALAKLQREAGGAQAELQRLRAAADEHKAAAAENKAAAEKAAAEAAAATAALGEQEASYEQRLKAMAEAHEAELRARAEAAASDAAAEVQRQQALAAEAAAARERAEASLAALRDEHAALREKHAAVTEEHGENAEALAAARAELEAQAGKLAELQAEKDTLAEEHSGCAAAAADAAEVAANAAKDAAEVARARMEKELRDRIAMLEAANRESGVAAEQAARDAEAAAAAAAKAAADGADAKARAEAEAAAKEAADKAASDTAAAEANAKAAAEANAAAAAAAAKEAADQAAADAAAQLAASAAASAAASRRTSRDPADLEELERLRKTCAEQAGLLEEQQKQINELQEEVLQATAALKRLQEQPQQEQQQPGAVVADVDPAVMAMAEQKLHDLEAQLAKEQAEAASVLKMQREEQDGLKAQLQKVTGENAAYKRQMQELQAVLDNVESYLEGVAHAGHNDAVDNILDMVSMSQSSHRSAIIKKAQAAMKKAKGTKNLMKALKGMGGSAFGSGGKKKAGGLGLLGAAKKGAADLEAEEAAKAAAEPGAGAADDAEDAAAKQAEAAAKAKAAEEQKAKEEAEREAKEAADAAARDAVPVRDHYTTPESDKVSSTALELAAQKEELAALKATLETGATKEDKAGAARRVKELEEQVKAKEAKLNGSDVGSSSHALATINTELSEVREDMKNPEYVAHTQTLQRRETTLLRAQDSLTTSLGKWGVNACVEVLAEVKKNDARLAAEMEAAPTMAKAKETLLRKAGLAQQVLALKKAVDDGGGWKAALHLDSGEIDDDINLEVWDLKDRVEILTKIKHNLQTRLYTQQDDSAAAKAMLRKLLNGERRKLKDMEAELEDANRSLREAERKAREAAAMPATVVDDAATRQAALALGLGAARLNYEVQALFRDAEERRVQVGVAMATLREGELQNGQAQLGQAPPMQMQQQPGQVPMQMQPAAAQPVVQPGATPAAAALPATEAAASAPAPPGSAGAANATAGAAPLQQQTSLASSGAAAGGRVSPDFFGTQFRQPPPTQFIAVAGATGEHGVLPPPLGTNSSEVNVGMTNRRVLDNTQYTIAQSRGVATVPRVTQAGAAAQVVQQQQQQVGQAQASQMQQQMALQMMATASPGTNGAEQYTSMYAQQQQQQQQQQQCMGAGSAPGLPMPISMSMHAQQQLTAGEMAVPPAVQAVQNRVFEYQQAHSPLARQRAVQLFPQPVPQRPAPSGAELEARAAAMEAAARDLERAQWLFDTNDGAADMHGRAAEAAVMDYRRKLAEARVAAGGAAANAAASEEAAEKDEQGNPIDPDADTFAEDELTPEEQAAKFAAEAKKAAAATTVEDILGGADGHMQRLTGVAQGGQLMPKFPYDVALELVVDALCESQLVMKKDATVWKSTVSGNPKQLIKRLQTRLLGTHHEVLRLQKELKAEQKAAPGTGALEKAERLVGNDQLLVQAKAGLVLHKLAVGASLAGLREELADEGTPKRLRLALNHRRKAEMRKLDHLRHELDQIHAQRQHNMALVVNAYGRINQLAGSVFHGAAYQPVLEYSRQHGLGGGGAGQPEAQLEAAGLDWAEEGSFGGRRAEQQLAPGAAFASLRSSNALPGEELNAAGRTPQELQPPPASPVRGGGTQELSWFDSPSKSEQVVGHTVNPKLDQLLPPDFEYTFGMTPSELLEQEQQVVGGGGMNRVNLGGASLGSAAHAGAVGFEGGGSTGGGSVMSRSLPAAAVQPTDRVLKSRRRARGELLPPLQQQQGQGGMTAADLPAGRSYGLPLRKAKKQAPARF